MAYRCARWLRGRDAIPPRRFSSVSPDAQARATASQLLAPSPSAQLLVLVAARDCGDHGGHHREDANRVIRREPPYDPEQCKYHAHLRIKLRAATSVNIRAESVPRGGRADNAPMTPRTSPRTNWPVTGTEVTRPIVEDRNLGLRRRLLTAIRCEDDDFWPRCSRPETSARSRPCGDRGGQPTTFARGRPTPPARRRQHHGCDA